MKINEEERDMLGSVEIEPAKRLNWLIMEKAKKDSEFEKRIAALELAIKHLVQSLKAGC